MTEDSFARLIGGLESAVAHAEGRPTKGTRVHVPNNLDVAAIRARTSLSQAVFSGTIGVSVDTLQNWEQGRRQPQGPARVLLAMLDKNPSVVEETLGQP
ncbi:helix-turn-helix domain-containing protein [Methylobacterium sp. CM6247]